MVPGLCSRDDFKDNCGFGLIASTKGTASHELLSAAIQSLRCMTHRGGIAADNKTGDGCGLLLAKPDDFFRKEADRLFGAALPDVYAVGMVFLSKDSKKAQEARDHLEQQLVSEGLHAVGWREVPVNDEVCGPLALASLPRIEQVFVGGVDLGPKEMDRRLFVARRHTEKRMEHCEDFYFVSLSTGVIGYKGLIMPEDLPEFYLDLKNESLATSICVFHQRFSTNTLPRWRLAQPFRFLAHNGEINTISGNINWSVARTPLFESPLLPDVAEIAPLVDTRGSDSACMDNMLEVLVHGGMDMFRALRMMVPPAWQNVEHIDADLRAFYEYNSMHMEPWDGPAGVVLTDGRYAVCLLDRNGLRPARWVLTDNNWITLASEVGTYPYPEDRVIAKGRLGPGQIFAVDTLTGKILESDVIDGALKSQYPYKKWLKQRAQRLYSAVIDEKSSMHQIPSSEFQAYQKMFGVTFEERDQVLRVLAESGQEAVGSMGDDTPMAVLSSKPRQLTDYFRQKFAQVTNPPIDPLRESLVMSLETCVGVERNVFKQEILHADRIILTTPVLSHSKFRNIVAVQRDTMPVERTSLLYDQDLGLEFALSQLCNRVEQQVREGKVVVVLSDRGIKPGIIPIHAALATGAVHHHLVRQGLRCHANIVLETGYARDPHQFAVLVGVGATAVYPYLAYNVIEDLVRTGELSGDAISAHRLFRKAITKGLFKVLSKMGISTVASYRGSQLFEAIGLAKDVIDLCFPGMPSRISGSKLEHLAVDQKAFAAVAWKSRKNISQGGLLKYVHGQEYHAFNPDVVQSLIHAVRSGEYEDYKIYANLVNDRGVATLRDLLALQFVKEPLALEQVEPVEAILSRFDSAGMSLGALSPEAHESIAEAMNRLNGRSNSGEGGEDPTRYGTVRNSKIKQVASGRFGVTAAYLMSAEVIQIKISQGAKPGEGGQLPGGKVNGLIAKLRYATPGVTLISPPPHHDIYSIEDLAQLIFDLKQVNPKALVSVKLVSEPGVGVIATGVGKAYADLITISGYDGGTAASPLSSIKHAGSPWELGLAETHQALQLNELRGRVRVQTDGGLKTGLDVIKAAILGAESFGFGTTPMIALGCKYLRICHLNNCATGVATQDVKLREGYFSGEVEQVMNFFKFVASETRQWLALLGFNSLDQIIGRTDLLKQVEGLNGRHKNIDLSSILYRAQEGDDAIRYAQQPSNPPHDRAEKAELVLRAVKEALANERKRPPTDEPLAITLDYDINNCDRSFGARVSGYLAKKYGDHGLASNPIRIRCKGTAGQSFGVWNVSGLHLELEGDANDYVGKGMTGGQIVLRPDSLSQLASQDQVIMGNTCLYGATGGRLFAAGQVGERFAVRNSGAVAVVEGAGDHCCEYMTGGCVVVLGAVGSNFGAGMTGGFAYVLDKTNGFVDRYNRELVEISRVVGEAMTAYQHYLYSLIEEFVAQTQSPWGHELLDDFDDYVRRFWLVKPKAANLQHLLTQTRAAPQ